MGYNNRGSNQGKGHKKQSAPIGVPTAPYNFVKLNDVVLEASMSNEASYKRFLLDNTPKFSGYFDIEIENLTPFFIDDGSHNFFSDGENLCIPGSSMRGCIKNYFKIITNGTMRIGKDGDVTDRLMYYRTFASKYPRLRKAYNKEVTKSAVVNNKRIDVANTEAGFLVRKGKEFFICPAKYKKIFDVSTAKRRLDTVDWNDASVNVYTGFMFNKKHYYRITEPKWNVRLQIPEKVIDGYCSDERCSGMRLLDGNKTPVTTHAKTSADGFRILKGAEEYSFIVPCFYVADGNKIRHFGSGPLYRVPYKKTIADHIPADVNADRIDFAAAIFGNKEMWSTRVYFENLYLQKNNGKENKDYILPLMEPHTTSFQNYLEPEGKEARHWNDDTNIRGYKMYWHKKMSWRRHDGAKNFDITKEIAPLRTGCRFAGRVRFENLSREELGALAKTLSLGANGMSAYKLGMGKSIGMGSVKLQSRLHLQADNYYTRLFAGDSFDESFIDAPIQQYVDSFDSFMKNVIGEESYRLYEDRIRELNIIMNDSYLNQKEWPNWPNKTAYMEVGDERYNLRIPLPSITEVVNKK